MKSFSAELAMAMRVLRTPFLVASFLTAACAPPDPGRPDFEVRSFLRIVAAEDVRPTGGRNLETLLCGTASGSPRVRAVSVRALGRLEDPALVERIAPLLGDPDQNVRREAVNALAQAVHRGSGHAVLPTLLGAARKEPDPLVLGAIARSLGRLHLDSVRASTVGRELVTLSRSGDGDAPPYQMEGVALGMSSFVRALGASPSPAPLQARLAEMTHYGLGAPESDVGPARVRALSVATYVSSAATPEEMRSFLSDRSDRVRLAAASRLALLPEALCEALGQEAMADPSAQVRLEAVRRGLASPSPTAQACARLMAAAKGDSSTAVRLVAVDALAIPCANREAQGEFLGRLADEGAAGLPADWHVGGHALAALASLDARRARPRLSAWAAHPNLFARTWAATAAARVGDASILRTLAADVHPNVRTEALRGLAGVLGRGADADLIAALEQNDDNQLLLTAATLLEGTTVRGAAADAAIEALDRISEPRWETLRDARVALLTLVETVGDTSRVTRVEPYLDDYDPAVAARAAQVLHAWTGATWVDVAQAAPPLPPPTEEELRTMETATVALHMARGGVIEIRLLPWQAPTNAVRFLRMAAAHTLDGLTFHRWAPNFVIQGGSPGASEYAGHGAYTRDEVSLVENWRGTVGLSTRGRDTGDGQIYVNLVDNVRLDHDYTVFGVVVSGMNAVDDVLEGDVIERAVVWP